MINMLSTPTVIEAEQSTRRFGSDVVIAGLTRRFGSVVALEGFDLVLGAGEFVALLGPSGCGKTTALRIVAGLERSDAGSVRVNGSDITTLPANQRNMGMVFQAYSLFPNMTARENIEYGLAIRKQSKPQRIAKSAELLDLVGLAEKANTYPHQLSGGQQQRVALARALAIEPNVLLLDEPLSALDAQVRTQIRDEIRRIQLSVGITTLFVTHDQEEAMAVADRVGVMRNGRLEQIDRPEAIYANPATLFVAGFVGTMNQIPCRKVDANHVEVMGRVVRMASGSDHQTTSQVPMVAYVRPEAIGLSERVPSNGSAGMPGRVLSRSFLGPLTRVVVDAGPHGLVQVDLASGEATGFTPGTDSCVSLATNEALVGPLP